MEKKTESYSLNYDSDDKKFLFFKHPEVDRSESKFQENFIKRMYQQDSHISEAEFQKLFADPDMSKTISEIYITLQEDIDRWLLELENPVSELRSYYYQLLKDKQETGYLSNALSVDIELLNPQSRFSGMKENILSKQQEEELHQYKEYERKAIELVNKSENKYKQESNTCSMM